MVVIQFIDSIRVRTRAAASLINFTGSVEEKDSKEAHEGSERILAALLLALHSGENGF